MAQEKSPANKQILKRRHVRNVETCCLFSKLPIFPAKLVTSENVPAVLTCHKISVLFDLIYLLEIFVYQYICLYVKL